MQMAPGLARDVFTVLIAAAGLAACGNNVQTLPVGQATAISHVRPSDRTERVVYSFRGKPDGWNPFGSLTADNDGTIYGTTFGGGSVGFGTVFALSPRIRGTANASSITSSETPMEAALMRAPHSMETGLSTARHN